MDSSLVIESTYPWISRINEIHLYLFILTIVIIMLASLYVYMNSKINSLENKIQNIDYLLDFHKSNIDVLFSENIQQKIKIATRIRELTKYTNEMINQLLDSNENNKNNYKHLFELIEELKNDIKLLQNEQIDIYETAKLKNEYTGIIEKMSKINLKTDQLYKMVVNVLSFTQPSTPVGVTRYHCFFQGINLENTDFPLEYLVNDNFDVVSKCLDGKYGQIHKFYVKLHEINENMSKTHGTDKYLNEQWPYARGNYRVGSCFPEQLSWT